MELMEKKHCSGCYNDDYNHGLGGAKECFNFDINQRLVKKYRMHIDQPPPYGKDQIVKVPPCYREQKYAHVDLDAINEKGFWKG